MRRRFPRGGGILLFLSIVSLLGPAAFAADHNDPNAINSIFFQTEANPADLPGERRPGRKRGSAESSVDPFFFS